MLGVVFALLIGSSSALQVLTNQSSALKVLSDHGLAPEPNGTLYPGNSYGWAAMWGDPDFIYGDPSGKAIYCYAVYQNNETYAKKLIGWESWFTGWQYVEFCMKDNGFQPWLKDNGHYAWVPEDSEEFIYNFSASASCQDWGYDLKISDDDPYYNKALQIWRKTPTPENPVVPGLRKLLRPWIVSECKSWKHGICHPNWPCDCDDCSPVDH